MRRPLAAAFLLALPALLGLLGASPAVRPALAEDAPPPDIDEVRGYVGWRPGFVQFLDAEPRKELGFTRENGLGVMHVVLDGPAMKAGLKVGDVILEISGTKIPDTSGISKDDMAKAEAFLKEVLTPITHKVRPGDKVTFVVERAGKQVTIEAIAVDKATQDALIAAEQEEEASVKVPSPKDAGAPAAAAHDFEKVPDGESRPEGWLNVTGLFEVRIAPDSAENHVLLQDSDMGDLWASCLLVGKGHAYGDATAKVRWFPISGEQSVSGGVVVRAQDRKNFYVVRADGVSRTLRVIAVRKGKAEVLASAELGSPKLMEWHDIEVTCAGDKIRASVDGKTKVEAKDAAWASGWFGLATWGDSVSAFDAFSVKPAGK